LRGSTDLPEPSIGLRRLQAQRLVGPRHATEVDAVRSLVAVQAQDYPGAAWAIGQRVAASRGETIDRLLADGRLVRTHVLRPTWHLVAAEDIRWLLALTGPRVQLANAGWYGRHGIDAEAIRASRVVLERVLGGGNALAREELGRAFTEAGIAAAGPRLAGLMMHAELDGIVCSGPLQGRRQTYALLEALLPPSVIREPDEALAELASRYVAGHGPAQAIDLAWWSGLTVREVRRGLELAGSALRRETVGGRQFWAAAASEGTRFEGPVVRLLPNWDELLVAFRDRSDAIDPGLSPAARAPVSLLANLVVRDGLVVGGWRRSPKRDGIRVTTRLDVALDESERAALQGAAAELAAFRGRGAAVVAVD
jgi:Winged helix DNA-binding domain